MDSTEQLSRRRIFLGIGGGMAGAPVLAACGAPGSGSEGAASSKGPVSVILWDRHETGYDAFMNAWVPIFNQKYSGKVNLTWESRSSEWSTKLTTAIVSGTPPDVAAVFGPWFRDAQEKKQIQALDKHIKASNFDANDFVPGIYRAMNMQGSQVGIPQYINTNALYYNRDIFKRYGVAFPAENWTHDQFLDTAQKLTRGPQSAREVWGFDCAIDSISTRGISLCWGASAQYNDPRNPDVFTLNTPQNIRALQWVHDLFWKLRLMPANNNDRGGVGRTEAVLIRGTAAMMIEGTHILAEWKTRAQADWDIAMLPKGPGGRGERLSMDGYVIPVGVKATDAAWMVLQEITGKDANKMRAEMLGYVPARKSQFDVWTRSIPGRNLKYALPADEARVGPDNVWPRARDVTDAINPIWRRAFSTNEIGVADALKQMQEAVAGILGAPAAR